MSKKKQEEQQDGAPAWMVSFSDMVTLLLAFFVLLQSFAKQQDPELFLVGQGSFRRAIQGLGVPDMLLGKPDHLTMRYRKSRHTMEEDPNSNTRLVKDAWAEKVYEAFAEIRQNIECEASDIRERRMRMIATAVRFGPSETTLSAGDREELAKAAKQIASTVTGRSTRVYVIGLAADEATPKRQMLVSAERAQAAETALRQHLPPPDQGGPELTSIGAGRGEQYSQMFDTAGKHCQVVIAVKEVE